VVIKISLSIAIQFLWQNVTIRSGMKSQAFDEELSEGNLTDTVITVLYIH